MTGSGVDPDMLERQLSAARGEADFHQQRTVYLERQLTKLTAALSAFEMHNGHLVHVCAQGGGCATEITCETARAALRALLVDETTPSPAPAEPADTDQEPG